MKKSKSMIISFTLPGTILFFSVFLYPIIRTVFMSFFSISNITDKFSAWKFMGIKNYTNLLQSGLYIKSWSNLINIFLIGGIITLGVSLILAALLESGVKAKGFFRAAIYMPNIVSAVAMATMWIQYVFNPSFGFMTKFFTFLHLDGLAEIQWFDDKHKFWALLISYCFGMIGHHVLIWIAGIQKIGQDFYEAASIDGASKFKQFTKITLPLLKGTLRTNLIMWSISISGFFMWSKLFSPLTSDKSTIVPMIYMYDKLFGADNTDPLSRDAGMGAAIGVMLCIFVVVIFSITNKLLKDTDLEY